MLNITLVSAANRILIPLMTFLLGFGLAGVTQTTAAVTSSAVMVSTLTGTAGVIGNADGSGGAAGQFTSPLGIAANTASNPYVTDSSNYTIRKITAAGVVTTLAGSSAAAQFNQPLAITADTAGNVYVADANNHYWIKAWAPTISAVISALALLFTARQLMLSRQQSELRFKLDTLVYATAQFDRLADLHAREEMNQTKDSSIKDYLSSLGIDKDKKKVEQLFMEYVYTFNRLGAGIYCGSLDRRTIFNIWAPSFFVARWKKFETFVREKQTTNREAYRFFEWLATEECVKLRDQYPEAKVHKVWSSPASK